MGDFFNCDPIDALLTTGSGDDAASVARSHSGDPGTNTLDTESPSGASLDDLEAVDAADAKTDGGAGWVADSTGSDSDAEDAAKACDPGSTGSSEAGAAAGGNGSGGDLFSQAGAAVSAAIGAAQSALW